MWSDSETALLAIRVDLPCYSFLSILYGNHVHQRRIPMDSISVNKFRDNLKYFVEQVTSEHLPLKVTRRSGEDFVVISAEDWAREQETLNILQNNDLMKQITRSIVTHSKKNGYIPTAEELNEITGI